MVETGIKVIDLFAPLVRGGVAGAISRPGVGQVVLLAELLHRLRAQRGFATVLWLPDEVHPNLDELVAESSVSAVSEILALVEAQRGERDVFVVADRGHVLSGEMLQLHEQLRAAGSRPVTFGLYDLSGDAAYTEGAPFGPLEAVWRFDTWLAAEGLYPAIDPVLSTSVVLEGAQLEASQLTVATAARRLMRRYQELRELARVRGVETIPVGEQPTFVRGQRLEAFLTQPFYVAEPFTKRAGEWVPLADTLAGVRRIIEGAADAVDPEHLRYIGALKPPVPFRSG
jgi:F-type H+-transporting ATPase subunit beta